MKISVKPSEIIFLLVGAVAMTMATFFASSQVDRLRVEKEFAPYLSATVEGRGWPVAYMVDDPAKPNFENIGFEDRFFPGSALLDLVVIALLVGGAFLGLKLLEKFSAKR